MQLTVLTWDLSHDPAIPLSIAAESPQALGLRPDLTDLIALHPLDPTAESTRRAAGFLAYLSAMSVSGYTVLGPGEWTVAVADHGDRFTFIAVFPTPAKSETAINNEVHFQLYEPGLASFLVSAPHPLAAEQAVTRWFATDRAHVDPAAACKPLACPNTRIPGPGDSTATEGR